MKSLIFWNVITQKFIIQLPRLFIWFYTKQIGVWNLKNNESFNKNVQ